MAENLPHDEFDDLPKTGKVGAHRAAERGWREARIVLGAVIVTALLVGITYGALQIVRNGSIFNDFSAAPAESVASAEPSAPESSTSAPATASESPSAPAPSPSSTVVPKSLTVGVYNGTTRSGIAASAASTLTAAGWKVTTTTNAPASVGGKTNSVVYYSSPEYAAAAQQLAQALGASGGTVHQAVGTTQLSLVLGTSFTP